MGSLISTPETFCATSASDLSSYEYVFVKYSAESTDAVKVVELCESGVPCGILVKGEIAGVVMNIIPLNSQPAKLTASTTIAVDAKVGPTTAGEGVTVSSDTNAYFFVATEAATADNDIITGYTANGTISA